MNSKLELNIGNFSHAYAPKYRQFYNENPISILKIYSNMEEI